MDQLNSFADVLDAVDQLSIEDQLALVAIVQRRTAEKGHKRIAAEASEAQHEFASGSCRPVSVDDLMDEILA